MIAGLCTIMLTLSITFLVRMRMDTQESMMMVRDSQARIMLVAALQYIQETSRLGWRDMGKIGSDPWGDGSPGYEGFGWTDVRDGSIGPRGPRFFDPTSKGASDPRQGQIPVPAWWRSGPYPKDGDGIPSNAFTYAESALPAIDQRSWPCPGSAMRGDVYVEKIPPYAVRMQKVMNPFHPRPDEQASPEYAKLLDGPYDVDILKHRLQYDGGIMNPVTQLFDKGTVGQAWLPFIRQWREEGFGGLDPQPVADTWNEFRTGDDSPRCSSTNLAWFRVYREVPSDHDNDGAPWFDRVPLQGHGIFIVTCGAGASLGYRFWSSADPRFSRSLEAVTAQESGLFVDEQMFRQIRQDECILWYRVEWTAMQGGGANAVEHYGTDVDGMWAGEFAHSRGGHLLTSWSDVPLDNRRVSFFGAMKWIQRLEKDPGRW
ncbi:MAG: hypothetical protein H0W83_02045 [Planctomycetes bacterium]|nr:hypothetical protein [Planctomycetota bacterium]